MGSPPHPEAIPRAAPPPYVGHYWAGSDYAGPTFGATDVRVTLQVPDDVPQGGSANFYYVLLSVWDTAGSYDQLGLANSYGAWGIAYSTSSFCAATYYYNPDAFPLQRGQAYEFDMTISASGVVHDTVTDVASGATLWTQSAFTGGTLFYLSPLYGCDGQGWMDYTDYEEVYATSGALVPYDFLFTNNAANGSAVTDWGAFGTVGGTPTLTDGANVTVENEPYYLSFPNGQDLTDIGSPSPSTVYRWNVSVDNLSEASPVNLSEYLVPTGWAVNLTPDQGIPPFTAEVSFSIPSTASAGAYLIGFNATDPNASTTAVRLALEVDLGPEVPVTFTESGLPSGTLWSIAIAPNHDPENSSTSPSLVLRAPIGGYPYRVFSANPAYTALFGSIVVNGAPLTVPIAFHLIGSPVTFVETGLPGAAEWTVGVNGTRVTGIGTTLTVDEPNGSVPYLISGPSGYRVTSPSPSGTISVQGPVGVNVSFAKGRTVALTFSEKGLPGGASWCVEVGGLQGCSTRSSEKFQNLTPGSYAYAVLSPTVGQTITAKVGAVPVPTSGTLTLAGRTTIALTFVYPFAVTFSETGLLSGSWSVIVRGRTHVAPAGSPIVFNLSNGSYGYKVVKEPGYVSAGSPKPVLVSGSAAAVTVTFTAARK